MKFATDMRIREIAAACFLLGMAVSTLIFLSGSSHANKDRQEHQGQIGTATSTMIEATSSDETPQTVYRGPLSAP